MSEPSPTAELIDNGGRRRIRDRRFLVSAAPGKERRTKWERRSGYDRRLNRIGGSSKDRRFGET